MENKPIACSHPGKMGDALYSLPIVRSLCTEWDCMADFYTSEYCKPMVSLVEYQSYIRKVVIPDNYKVLTLDMGVQPWHMPIDSQLYERVIHFGFRSVPNDFLTTFMAGQTGALLSKIPEISYEYPDFETLDEDYFCIAPRGNTTYREHFRSVIHNSPVGVVMVGGAGDAVTTEVYTNYDKPIIDLTGLNMLDTVTWLSKSVGFVGLMSAMLVLANGFDMPKVAVHDGIHWDMRHVRRSDTNLYPVNPNHVDVLGMLGV